MDFDTLVAETGPGGAAGSTGIGGSAGLGGVSGAAGSGDDGGEGGSAGTGGTGGEAGNAGAGGTGGTVDGGGGRGGGSPGDGAIDGGKGADASTDTATDRGADTIPDVRSETSFDCAAANGTVFQGHCYYPSPTKTGWDTASTGSCAPPSHLVTITTQAEQNVVATILAGNDRWIGLRKDPGPPNREDRFYWVTKEPVTYKIWDSYETGAPEPNYTGDCVRMRPTNAWGDTGCTEMYSAVCEYE
jgi:hypothetical protein